jgi:hypothetical protein
MRRRVTLRAYAADWLGRRRHLAPNSQRAYAIALARHVLPALGGVALTDLDGQTIRRFLARELATGAAPCADPPITSLAASRQRRGQNCAERSLQSAAARWRW